MPRAKCQTGNIRAIQMIQAGALLPSGMKTPDRGHLVQGDAGGHPSVQRLGGGRDRDLDQHVAGLGHDPGQPPPL